MFIFWKDYIGIKEVVEINEFCSQWEVDYIKYEGGIYFFEWFWVKILRIIWVDEIVRVKVYFWVEYCDWIFFLLMGGEKVVYMKCFCCVVGYKVFWYEDFDGFFLNDFFVKLDFLLDGVRDCLY